MVQVQAVQENAQATHAAAQPGPAGAHGAAGSDTNSAAAADAALEKCTSDLAAADSQLQALRTQLQAEPNNVVLAADYQRISTQMEQLTKLQTAMQLAKFGAS